MHQCLAEKTTIVMSFQKDILFFVWYFLGKFQDDLCIYFADLTSNQKLSMRFKGIGHLW